MAWSVIAESDVLSEFNANEQSQVTQANAVDNLPAILGRVVNMARSCIVAGGGRIDQAGTVPDQLRPDIIAIARWKWLLSIPNVNESLLSKQRQAAHDDAMKRLDLVSNGKLKIEVPANPLATTAPTNAVAVPRPGRHVDPDQFNKMGAT